MLLALLSSSSASSRETRAPAVSSPTLPGSSAAGGLRTALLAELLDLNRAVALRSGGSGRRRTSSHRPCSPLPSGLRVLRHQSGPSGRSGVKAFRDQKPEILLPSPHSSAAPAASVAGQKVAGSRLCAPRPSGPRLPGCQLLLPLQPREPLYRICRVARHLQLAEPRARAERGRAEAGAGFECQLLNAAGPTQPRPAPLSRQPMVRRGRLLMQICRGPPPTPLSLRKAQSPPYPPSTPLPSLAPPLPDSLPYVASV
uniref:Uncharacterized protein n=1 Tax=Rangifer tarandus platyrhynchus TaxID=3082113 RepID=A0ACB0F0L5_RANTA|nr:unnamed protein product [Rangifer tarandus platyrhynchus]